MKIIKAPEIVCKTANLSVFLAGSIESDAAQQWQQKVIEAFLNDEVTILNPRRDAWDTSWKQEINNPMFKQQVDWELQGLEDCDLIIMYFDKHTKSPISLLELGLFARSNKLVVCCPEGFWRKGNVDIVCDRYHIPQVASIEDLITYIKDKITHFQ